MYDLNRNSILIGAFLLAASTMVVNAQTAKPCVTPSYERFLTEIENIKKPFEQKGLTYLNAYGWIEATRACFTHASYPASKQQEAADFKSSIERLSQSIVTAIRTNSTPTIYALSQGSAGITFLGPKAAPSGAQSVMVVATGMVALATPQGATENKPSVFMLSLAQRIDLQRALLRKGHYTGEIDGVLGAGSYAAIKRYQRAQGLKQTGVLSHVQLQKILTGG
jgi:hypothetical protein